MSLVNAFAGNVRKELPEFKKFDVTLECKVCGCITLDSGIDVCWSCHWPLSDAGDPKAFGHEALVRFPRDFHKLDIEMKRVGPASKVRAAAKAKGGTVLAVRPLNRRQWINAYGNPEERGL